MKKVLFLIPFIILFGCSGQHAKLNKLIEKSTAVEIFVFSKDPAKPDTMIFKSNDLAKIKEFETYFTDKHTPQNNFKYEGKIVFRNDKSDTKVLFTLNPLNSHIAYLINYDLFCMKLSDKGLEFLKTLRNDLSKNSSKK